MHTGTLSSENLSSTLRSLSQRRRQGVLELVYRETQFKILFVQGKIVEVLEADKSPVVEVVELLAAAGYPLKVDSHPSQYAELVLQFGDLEGPESGMLDEVLKRAVSARILNKLYDLDLESGGYFHFKAQMVEYEREFAPAISVGQVLLDRVALDSEKQRFTEAFPESCVVRRLVEEASALNEEEQIIFDCARTPGIIETLRAKTLLNRFQFQEGLLSLHSRSLIGLAETERQESSSAESEKVQSKSLPEPAPLVEQGQAKDIGSRWHERLIVANHAALHSSIAPRLVGAMFLLICAVAPFFFWVEF